jgi:hypothetical protein
MQQLGSLSLEIVFQQCNLLIDPSHRLVIVAELPECVWKEIKHHFLASVVAQ